MSSDEHLRLLRQDLNTWNKWREENPNVRPDLSRADLSKTLLTEANLKKANFFRANLIGANLIEANLSEANLREVSLWGANLWGANLSKADLREADLIGVNFEAANLTKTNLEGTDLSRANLSRADLRETNLTNARIAWTLFGDVYLNSVRGLDTVKHLGPSTIGIDTLCRSEGTIPESFLRGTGVPEGLIQRFPVIIRETTQLDEGLTTITLRYHEYETPEHLPMSLTPQFISTTLCEYLQAIAEIQSIIDQMHDISTEPVTIRELSHYPPITIILAGASEWLEVVRYDINPWRQRHTPKVTRFDYKTLPESEREKPENMTARFELDRAKFQLIINVIRRMAPELPEADRIVYIDRLLTPIMTVATSPLEIEDIAD